MSQGRSLTAEYHQAKRNYLKSSTKPTQSTESDDNSIDYKTKRKPARLNTSCSSFDGLTHFTGSKVEPTATRSLHVLRSCPREVLIHENGNENAVDIKQRESKTCVSCKKDESPQRNVELGYQLLGVDRLSDQKDEVTLSRDILGQLVESIKLCGLRKAREKSVLGMVTALCKSLSDQEENFNKWMECADNLAISAVEQILLANHEYEVVFSSNQENYRLANILKTGLTIKHAKAKLLKKEVECLKNDVSHMMKDFSSMINNSWIRNLQYISRRIAHIRSDCKRDLLNVLNQHSMRHNEEISRFESVIHSLEKSNKLEKDHSTLLQVQLEDSSNALQTAKDSEAALQNQFHMKLDDLNLKCVKLHEENCRLENLLAAEKRAKRDELDEFEEKMKKELDEIEVKVKRSFKNLADSKKRDVDKALTRALAAEASAKAAEKMLTDLKDGVISTGSTSHESNKVLKSQ